MLATPKEIVLVAKGSGAWGRSVFDLRSNFTKCGMRISFSSAQTVDPIIDDATGGSSVASLAGDSSCGLVVHIA